MLQGFPQKAHQREGYGIKGVFKVVTIIVFLGPNPKKVKLNSEKVLGYLSSWCQ